jgi:hypothetical protein
MSTVQGGQGNIVTNGLVLNLDAANPRSYPQPYNGTTWQNIAPVSSSLTGSLINGVGYTGSNGGALVFDGTDDYVISTNVSGSGIVDPTLYNYFITFNVWFITTSTKSSQYVISTGSQTSSTGICLVLNDSGVNEYIEVAGFAKKWVVSNLDFIAPNIWYNVCVVTDNTLMYVYVNGNLRTSVTSGGSGKTPVYNSLTLGTPNNSPGNPTFTLVGRIASTQIYNRALNASEVLQNFNATRARFGV